MNKSTIVASALLALSSTSVVAAEYETGVRLGAVPTASQSHFRADQLRIRHAGGYKYRGKNNAIPTYSRDSQYNTVPAGHYSSSARDESSIVTLGEPADEDHYSEEPHRSDVGVRFIGGAAAGVGHVLGQVLARAIF